MWSSGVILPKVMAIFYSADASKEAGMGARDLFNAGFGIKVCVRFGGRSPHRRYPSQECLHAGVALGVLLPAGFTPSDARQEGVSAKDLLEAGAGVEALSAAGFACEECREGGATAEACTGSYPATELARSFSATELRSAGVEAQDVLQGGGCEYALTDGACSVKELLDAGADAGELKVNRVSTNPYVCAASPPLLAPPSPPPLPLPPPPSLPNTKVAGVDAVTLKREGCSAAALKEAFTIEEMMVAQSQGAAGHGEEGEGEGEGEGGGPAVPMLSVEEMHGCGYSIEEVLAAGRELGRWRHRLPPPLTSSQLLDSAEDVKRADLYSAKELKSVGADLKGISASAMVGAGCDVSELLAAGHSFAEIRKAKVSAREMIKGGATISDIKQAGFTPTELCAKEKPPFTAGELRGSWPLSGKRGGATNGAL